ncbi:MAG: hypothetical protein ACYSUT_13035 [Planctomycetota bacterium]|jgi:hypothetical protein
MTENEQHEQAALPIANVICIKWGRNYYTHEDVNSLYAMVRRNITQHELRFYCFTEIAEGLDEGILVKPLPELKVKKEDNRYAYRKEAGLCDDNLGGLAGKRVLFFDLDVVITGSLDEMIEYPKGDEFVIINDWNTRGDHVGQASCYSWVVGTLGYVKAHFEAHPVEMVNRFYTASQEYLSWKVIEKFGKLNFWPEDWCRSFKVHALPVWFLRRFAMSKLPNGTKVLAFHGNPKIEDALAGRWAPPGAEAFWKILLYKSIKPCRWLEQYL